MKRNLLVLAVIGCCALLVSDAAAQRKRGRKNRRGDRNALQVAEKAPEFKLKSLDGKSEFELASALKKKPVVLIFGSYT